MGSVKQKELSAGILFFTEDGELFMGRVTGSSGAPGLPHRWDIPKGHVEEGETPLHAAVRECQEETGFTDYDRGLLDDLGVFDYASNKDIHLFIYRGTVTHEQFRNCVCTTFHTKSDGSQIPEVDAFALIKPEMWLYTMGPSLFRVMQKLFPESCKKSFKK